MIIILTYLCAGVFAGLTAGLFGVGGGIVVVPVLIFAFESQGFSPEVLTHMAIATSLATIVFTSSSSMWSHHKKGAVLWEIFGPMSLGIVLGSLLGVWTVMQLKGELIKSLFGLFAIAVAFNMLLKRTSMGKKEFSQWPVFSIVGFFVAWFSALFGIGGGSLIVPFLSRYKIEMKQVVGTAAACGFPIAFVGALSNMLLGSNVPDRPDGSIGYVYLPALLGVSLTSIYCANLGANFAHYLPPERLRLLFSATLVLVGIKFLFF